MFYAGGFVKLKDGSDQNWTTIKSVVALPGKYKVAYQYHSSDLKNVIANKEQYEKSDVYGEYEPALIIPNDMPIQIAPEGGGQTMDDVLQKEKNRLRSVRYFAEHAGPDQRIYVCEYDFFDVNRDEVKDLVSFSVSNGKLVEVHIYTITNKIIKKIPAAASANAIKKSPVYQYLVNQSLLQKHEVGQ